MTQASRPIDVREAHDLLARHYGEPVLPIHEVCKGIQVWLGAIVAEHLPDPDGTEEQPWRDHALATIAQAASELPFLSLTASKSNLLFRLLYLRQPLRTKKCPQHDGHWSGYGECLHGCAVGSDVTGWLP